MNIASKHGVTGGGLRCAKYQCLEETIGMMGAPESRDIEEIRDKGSRHPQETDREKRTQRTEIRTILYICSDSSYFSRKRHEEGTAGCDWLAKVVSAQERVKKRDVQVI